jgi:hypothetical protein
MTHYTKPTPKTGRLLGLATVMLAGVGLTGCYYPPPGPVVAYCAAPPATADGQPSTVPAAPNGTCPQGTQPVYAQAAPAYAYPPPVYPYPYAYPYAYPPVAVGFGFHFR